MGCLFVLRYTRICDEAITVRTPPNSEVKQIDKPEFHRILPKSDAAIPNTTVEFETISQNSTLIRNKLMAAEWLSCVDIEKIYFEANSKASNQFR